MGLIITAGGILFNWIMSRSTNKLIANGQELVKTMHTETQQTLERMDTNWRNAFERMDQRADERYRDLRGHIDGEV